MFVDIIKTFIFNHIFFLLFLIHRDIVIYAFHDIHFRRYLFIISFKVYRIIFITKERTNVNRNVSIELVAFSFRFSSNIRSKG